MRNWLWSSASGVFLAASLVSAKAQAQEPVYVRLAAGQRDLTVLTRDGREVAACHEHCEFWAWPGKYRVRLRHGDDESTTTLRVRSPGDYRFDPGDVPLKSAGLFLGITGAAVTLVGAVVVVASAMSSSCDEDASDPAGRRCSTNPAVFYGLGTMAAGGGTSALGFVLFAQNRARFRYQESEGVSARLGVLPAPSGTRGGLTVGLSLAF